MDLWKSLKRKALLARQLSLGDWLLLAQAWWVLLGFWLALRWASYERLHELASSNPDVMIVASSSLDSAERLYRLVGMASNLHFLPMTCLVKATTLCWMLSIRGIPAQLRIGANKDASGIRAHAWVEIQGRIIGESQGITESFRVLSPSEQTLG